MNRLDERFSHEWHVAINKFCWPSEGERKYLRWMYEAKAMADEVPRLAALFRAERECMLPRVHRQCSRSPSEPIPENHLTCCLGVKCAECQALTALNDMDASAEQIDAAKAWTCAAHIASEGGDPMNEGYVLRVDDRMYWDQVYTSLSSGVGQPAEDD